MQQRTWFSRAALPAAIALLAASCGLSTTQAGGPRVTSLSTRGLVASGASASGTTVVAAPSGSPNGSGTTAHPLDLQHALSARSPVRPGGTVLLRGGTYRGAFVSEIHGTPAHPVVVRSYPGEWAVLDGGMRHAVVLAIRGSDSWVRDLEVTKSDPKRTSSQPGDGPTDQSRGGIAGVWLQAARTKLINVVVHDAGDGVGFWRQAVDSEIYGCVIFNNGWSGADRGWGHGIYVQNSTGTKTIADSVLFNNFGFGIHAYNGQDDLRGIHITGVTSFENGAPAGQREPNVYAGTESATADDISVTHALLYDRPRVSGYNAYFGHPTWYGKAPRANGSLNFVENRIFGGFTQLFVRDWQHANISKNAFADSGVSGGSLLVDLRTVSGTGALVKPTGYTWNGNTYDDVNAPVGGRRDSFAFDNAPGSDRKSRLTFAEWRHSTGFDTSSAYRPGPAASTVTVVRPNRFERGRALVTIFNARHQQRVSVDLSTALDKGERFVVRDVQDLDGTPLYSGAYDGQPVSLRLDSTAISRPTGGSTYRVSHTPIDFGVFIILPDSRA